MRPPAARPDLTVSILGFLAPTDTRSLCGTDRNGTLSQTVY